MDVLEIIKAKIPSENLPSDAILNIHVAEVKQAILTYCNRADIPNELTFAHANMVIDLIGLERRSTNLDEHRDVKSIKEGDVQTTFEDKKTSSSELSTQNVLNDYTSQLNSYRKLRW